MAFWDASAIIPLCCSQSVTTQVRRLRRELRHIVVWWGTPLEARSAFARLVRENSLTEDQRTASIRRLADLRVAWNEILPTEQLRALAEDLPDTRAIRAADAAQLAAALIWCRRLPKQRSFVCLDERLRAAASAAGFDVLP
jgi:predicted nucleic acid-binding protein